MITESSGILHTFPRAATADRRQVIGASAAPAILGLSPWQTPMGLWLAMQGQTPDVPSNVKRRGHYLEAGILQWTADEAGAVEVEPGIPISLPGIAGPAPHFAFHPDGALRMTDGAWRLAEIKTSRLAADWGEAGSDSIPLHYLAQVQFQLACCPGIEVAQVGVYLPVADELRTYTVAGDAEFQAWMFAELSAWHLRHIVEGQPPEIDGSKDASAYLRSRHPRQLADMRQASPSEVETVREFAAVKAQIAELEAREAVLGNELRAACGDHEGLLTPAGKVTWRHVSGAERIDSKRLRSEFPAAAVACTVKGDDRRDLRFWPAKG